jgi:hypothetical protein
MALAPMTENVVTLSAGFADDIERSGMPSLDPTDAVRAELSASTRCGTAAIRRGGHLVEFWIRDGETRDDVYDDIRGWAISNRLPIGHCWTTRHTRNPPAPH